MGVSRAEVDKQGTQCPHTSAHRNGFSEHWVDVIQSGRTARVDEQTALHKPQLERSTQLGCI